MSRTIQRYEWRFPALLALAIFLLGSGPYLYGYYATPPGQVFMDFVGRGTPGAQSYLAFARQVQEGQHLIQNKFTPEPTIRADYFNLEWWIFGQIARQTGWSLVTVFHVTRAAIVLFYVCVIYWFASLCLDTVRLRRLATALICLGSGLGWLVWLANQAGLTLDLPRDLRGVSIPAYLVNKPHFILSTAFVTLSQGFHLCAYTRGGQRYFVYSALAAAANAMVRPHAMFEAHVLWVLIPALLCLRDRAFALARFKGPALAIAVHSPVVLYFLYYTLTGSLGKPDYSRVSPHLLEIVLWMGLPMLGFILGLPRYLRLTGAPLPVLFLTAWILTAWLHTALHPYVKTGQEAAYYSYSLVPVLLLLGTGLPALHAWLNAAGPALAARLPRLDTPRAWRNATLLLLAACMPSTALVYTGFYTTLQPGPGKDGWTFYISQDLHDTLTWLDTHGAPEDVTFATMATSQFVWRLAKTKTFTGHDFLTINFHEKNGLVHRFYTNPGDEDFKRALLQQYRVRWLLYGDFERALGNPGLENYPWLRPAYTQGNTTLYEVLP